MVFKKDGKTYRISPKGCLYYAVMEAAEHIHELKDISDEQEYLQKYIEILYHLFEENMIDNDYRIINLDDFEKAGIFDE